MGSTPLKVAFVCQHGFTSGSVAHYAKKLEKEMPGIEIINRGFGHKAPHDTTKELAEAKPDLIFYIPRLTTPIFPGVKTVSGHEWAFTQKTVYGEIVPDRVSKEASNRLKELMEETNLDADKESWEQFHLSLALQAKNYLQKYTKRI